MKADDVPQDEGSCYGSLRRLTWAVGEDGRYRGVASSGWSAEIDATTVAVEATNERIRAAWELVRSGSLSPLAYHLEVARMTPGLLAGDAGVWGWRVRRHLTPASFARLGPALLARYAAALGLSVEDLRRLPAEPETL